MFYIAKRLLTASRYINSQTILNINSNMVLSNTA